MQFLLTGETKYFYDGKKLIAVKKEIIYEVVSNLYNYYNAVVLI